MAVIELLSQAHGFTSTEKDIATDGAEASKVTHDETAETSAQAESNPATTATT